MRIAVVLMLGPAMSGDPASGTPATAIRLAAVGSGDAAVPAGATLGTPRQPST